MSDRTAIPKAMHAPGDVLHGFRIDSATPLPDIRRLVVDHLERELAHAPTNVIAPQEQLEAVGASSRRPLEILTVAGP